MSRRLTPLLLLLVAGRLPAQAPPSAPVGSTVEARSALTVLAPTDSSALVSALSLDSAARLPYTAELQVKQWTDRYLTSHRSTLERAILRAQPWAPMIATRLRDAGLPAALVYLPVIESSYHPWARSSAGAVGLWQFMPATARELGLRITPWVDERRDPWRATDAAMRHLKSLARLHHGDWFTILAAYNAGSGRVGRATRMVQVSSWQQRYWAAQALLPAETRHYVPQLLAVTRIGSRPDAFGIRVPRDYRMPALHPVPLPPASRLDVLAQVWGVPVDVVAGWNPALRWAATPPNEYYTIRVPATSGAEANAKLARYLKLPKSKRTLSAAQIRGGNVSGAD